MLCTYVWNCHDKAHYFCYIYDTKQKNIISEANKTLGFSLCLRSIKWWRTLTATGSCFCDALSHRNIKHMETSNQLSPLELYTKKLTFQVAYLSTLLQRWEKQLMKRFQGKMSYKWKHRIVACRNRFFLIYMIIYKYINMCVRACMHMSALNVESLRSIRFFWSYSYR